MPRTHPQFWHPEFYPKPYTLLPKPWGSSFKHEQYLQYLLWIPMSVNPTWSSSPCTLDLGYKAMIMGIREGLGFRVHAETFLKYSLHPPKELKTSQRLVEVLSCGHAGLLRFRSLGCRVQGLGFRVQGLGFRV